MRAMSGTRDRGEQVGKLEACMADSSPCDFVVTSEVLKILTSAVNQSLSGLPTWRRDRIKAAFDFRGVLKCIPDGWKTPLSLKNHESARCS